MVVIYAMRLVYFAIVEHRKLTYELSFLISFMIRGLDENAMILGVDDNFVDFSDLEFILA